MMDSVMETLGFGDLARMSKRQVNDLAEQNQ